MKLKERSHFTTFFNRHATSPKGMAVCVSENYLAAEFFFLLWVVELLLIKYKRTFSL